MGLLMVIAMALMLGVGGGHMHMMGHEKHIPDAETTKLKTPQQDESMSADQKKRSAAPHNHADSKE
jgi:hypothetical protein